MISVVLLLALVLTGYFFLKKREWKNSPPGPPRWPIMGNLFQIGPLKDVTFGKWAQKYGPICRVDLGSKRAVVLSDPQLIKEAFSKAEFSGRPDFSMFDFAGLNDGKNYGVFSAEGPHWEEVRRFTLRNLREFGFGKSALEDSIMTEVNELINIFKAQGEKPAENIKDKLHFAVVNALWTIVAGKRWKYDDQDFINATTESIEAFQKVFGSLATVIPLVGKIAPGLSGLKTARIGSGKIREYFLKTLEEHAESGNNSEGDFIDMFRKEIKKTKDPDSAFHGKVGETNLLVLIRELYIAGTDTTSTTLAWMTLYLSKMPYIQRKLQEEIDSVVGRDRQVSVMDRPTMPYTEAVIAETLRYSSIVGIGIHHKTLEDVEFHGYSIPKGTFVIANLRHIHFDPKIWEDPLNFRPERFLSPDGQTFKKHEALIPFAVGKRQCLGESLARDNLFLFTANIFQTFNIEFDHTGPDPGFEPEPSLVLKPKDFRVIFNERL